MILRIFNLTQRTTGQTRKGGLNSPKTGPYSVQVIGSISSGRQSLLVRRLTHPREAVRIAAGKPAHLEKMPGE